MFDMSRVRDCWGIYILVSFCVVSLVLESLEALVESLLLNLGVAVFHLNYFPVIHDHIIKYLLLVILIYLLKVKILKYCQCKMVPMCLLRTLCGMVCAP